MKSDIKQRITQLNKGEVPNGYKKTEFGVFPCDWVVDKTFGDLFDFYGGLGKSREELGDEGHAYLHYGDLHRGTFNVVSHEQYKHLPQYDVTLKGTETYLMEDGDVAFLDASEDLEGTSRAVVIDNPDNDPFIAGLHIIYGKSKDDSLDKWYKQYITLPESVRKQFQKLAVGFKVYGLNRETLPKIHLAYPESTAEQSKIAEILMKWDEAIELQEQYIEKLIIKQKYIMRKLLTPNDSWKTTTFEKIGRIYQPSTISESELIESGYLVYGANGIIGFYDKYNHEKSEVAITCRGSTCGEVAFTQPKSWITGNAMVFSPDEELLSKKFAYYLCTVRNFNNIISGSGQPQITRQALSKQKLSFPNKKEQNKIECILTSVEETITYNKNKLSFLYKQCKALQQYLLNGIVRV